MFDQKTGGLLLFDSAVSMPKRKQPLAGICTADLEWVVALESLILMKCGGLEAGSLPCPIMRSLPLELGQGAELTHWLEASLRLFTKLLGPTCGSMCPLSGQTLLKEECLILFILVI